MKKYYNYWGKLDGSTGRWHPLVCHMLDVAAVASEVLNREPASTKELYASDFGLTWNDAEGWILFFIALHDIGKATPSFQKMCEDKIPELRSLLFDQDLRWDENVKYVHHGQLGQSIFDREIKTLFEAGPHNLEFVSRAVNDHHGFHEQADRKSNLRHCGLKESQLSWQETRRQLILNLMEFFVNIKTQPDYNSFNGPSYMRLAGLTSFSDWIGSDNMYFPYIQNGNEFSMEKYWDAAHERAQNALNSIGWMKSDNLYKELPSFNEVVFDEIKYDPRPLQKFTETMIASCKGPSLVLMEAPTGEGKTEAALYAHIALQYSNHHRGLYVALPSQATGNAMFRRTLNFLTHNNKDISLDLQLIHGAALLNDEYQKLRLLSIYDNEDSETTVSAHEWFTHKKRALLSAYGVGTVDQALLSVLNVKHAFVRLWGLGNRTIIIDEVHAYDVYTSTILDRLLVWLKALGSSVIIMSATLPRKRRKELLQAWGASESEDVAYPRLITVDANENIRRNHFPVDEKRKRDIVIKPAPVEVDKLSMFALEQVKDDGCLAIIVNTVQRAQSLYQSIKESAEGIELYLFHARFSANVRKKKEEQVLSLFGKPGENVKRPSKSILIATQVVEQSLDLDFDVMISDLAPIDLLLQRAGRIHRHERPLSFRYHHSAPVLHVCGLGGKDLPDFGKPLYWDKVYIPYILYRTWILLGGGSKIKLPDSIDEVIESVYGDNPLDEKWLDSAEIKETRKEMESIIEEDRSIVNNLLGRPIGEEWANPTGLPKIEDEDMKPGTHLALHAKTRKGDKSITLIILFKINDHLCLDKSGNNVVDMEKPVEIKDAKQLLENSVSLSRKDVYFHFINTPVPDGWKKNPLLRNCRPLILDDYEYNTKKTIIRYTEELGVYYEKTH